MAAGTDAARGTEELTLDDVKAALRRGARVTLLVRHAERPKMDPNDATFGDALAITDEGRRTSRAFGCALAAFGAAASFYASPLTRTRMTAAEIAAGMNRAGAAIPTDERLGNGSFYYADAAQVLEVFKPQNFFPASFEYFATGAQRGFRDLYEATDDFERWINENAKTPLFIVVTHDLYIAAFLAARHAVKEFTRENWTRFLDAGAIIDEPTGVRRYGLVRTGFSTGIVGVVLTKGN